MNEQIRQAFIHELVLNVIYQRRYLEDILEQAGINNYPNITSMTYNRWNDGMNTNHINPLFEYVGRNQYKYLSWQANYSGIIKRYVQGGNPIQIGNWVNGLIEDYEGKLKLMGLDFESYNQRFRLDQNQK